MKKLIELAILQASKTTGRYRLGAVIADKKGNILSVGHNSYSKTHPKMAKYSKFKKIHLHAEMDALIKLSKHKRKAHTLIVVRILKDGTLVNAKPCPYCNYAIKDFGIQKVHHS